MLTCTACGFACEESDIMILHQSICEKLPADKREYRETLARAMYGNNLEVAQGLVRAMMM